jgi:hypothetical protein
VHGCIQKVPRERKPCYIAHSRTLFLCKFMNWTCARTGEWHLDSSLEAEQENGTFFWA